MRWPSYFDNTGDEDYDDKICNAYITWWKECKRMKAEKVGEIARWVLKRNNSLALSIDRNGMNPFQYAVSTGKRWHEGIL